MKRVFQNLKVFSIIALVFAFSAISGHSVSAKDGERMVYYCINATPEGAKVIIDGMPRDTLLASYGSVVSWEVSKEGYVTQSGTDTISTLWKKSVNRVHLQEIPTYTISVLVEPECAMRNSHITVNGKESQSIIANYGERDTIIVYCEYDFYTDKTDNKGIDSSLTYYVFIIFVLLCGLIVLLRRNRHKNEKVMYQSTLATEKTKSATHDIDADSVNYPGPDNASVQSPASPYNIGTKRKGQVKFAILAKDWEVVGASVQGNGHKSSDVPCQDSCAYEYLKDGWGIAIASDGAGSAEHSDVGSKITVARSMSYLKQLIENQKWIENKELPTDNTWTRLAFSELRKVRDDIYGFSEKNNIDFKSLSATIIVVVHSPYGLLVAHIGDGRAGYKALDGVWHSMITPHKGEEANQTIFLTSGFWDIPFFEMSGVMVPEARVIRQPVAAFTLMSDGCENTSWLCNQRDEQTGHFYDPNKPFYKFFDPLIASLRKECLEGAKEDDIENNWQAFIAEGAKGFVLESDDKTMVLGFTL